MPSEILFDDCRMMCVKARDSVLKKKKKKKSAGIRRHIFVDMYKYKRRKNNKRLSGIHDLMSI